MKIFRGLAVGLLVALCPGHPVSSLADEALPKATIRWSVKLGHIGCSSSPALAPDGTIYQATYDGSLLAFTPQGKIRWQYSTGTEMEIKSSPAVAEDGTIYFGARDRTFYAVTASGKLKWVFPTGAWVDSSPAIGTDGTIYFGGWDKDFYALNPTGTVKWHRAMGAIVVSSPAIARDGTIYFGAFDKYMYALTATGELKWRFPTGAEITSSPAIGPDGSVYFTSMDGNLYALKADGTERWRFPLGTFTEASPVLDEQNNLYIPGTTSEIRINQAGQGLNVSGISVPVEVSAVAVAGRIYWSRPWRSLEAYLADGTVLWRADTEANLSSSPVVGLDGMIYFMGDRFLYAVQTVGPGLPPARSSWPMFRGNAQHTGRVGGL